MAALKYQFYGTLVAVWLAPGVLSAAEPEMTHQKAASRLSKLGAQIDEGTYEGKQYCTAKFDAAWKGKPDDLRELSALKHFESLHIASDAGIGDAGLKQLARLKGLKYLSIFDDQVTDAGIAELSGLEQIQLLVLHQKNLTDAGLKSIARLKTLTGLVLDGSQITDDGLAELAPLKNLEAIRINNTKTTDSGLEHLVALKKLRVVGASQTQITKAGVAKLQAALPKCRVIWDETSLEELKNFKADLPKTEVEP